VYDDAACNPYDLDHAVIAIGYGNDAASGKDYWLVRNSWGVSWGEKGYVKIARQGNICGVTQTRLVPIDK
jgi:cathepsin L